MNSDDKIDYASHWLAEFSFALLGHDIKKNLSKFIFCNPKNSNHKRFDNECTK